MLPEVVIEVRLGRVMYEATEALPVRALRLMGERRYVSEVRMLLLHGEKLVMVIQLVTITLAIDQGDR
ncbi:hypothetical protein D9M71_663510 [compost metagenome]